VVLFEMTTGKMPFRGEHEAAVMYSIVNEEPENASKFRNDIPDELLHIMKKSLEKDPRTGINRCLRSLWTSDD
jgi:serine/threonine protein kinase